jgi:glutathione S-transferase
LNPIGKIPFLIDRDFKISESNAILVYLCEKYPELLAKYYGTTAQERAKVNQHLSWYQNFYRPALFKIIVLKIYQGIRQRKPVIAKYVQAAEKDMF